MVCTFAAPVCAVCPAVREPLAVGPSVHVRLRITCATRAWCARRLSDVQAAVLALPGLRELVVQGSGDFSAAKVRDGSRGARTGGLGQKTCHPRDHFAASGRWRCVLVLMCASRCWHACPAAGAGAARRAVAAQPDGALALDGAGPLATLCARLRGPARLLLGATLWRGGGGLWNPRRGGRGDVVERLAASVSTCVCSMASGTLV